MNVSFSTAGQCGRTTSLAATPRMRSRPYWISTSDIKHWVKQEHLLWWAQSRTWQKSLLSWWNLMERSGTWSDEPRATEPSQLFFQTPEFRAQLFDGSMAACDTHSCTVPCATPTLWSCLGFRLSSQNYSALSWEKTKHLLAQSTSECHEVTSDCSKES